MQPATWEGKTDLATESVFGQGQGHLFDRIRCPLLVTVGDVDFIGGLPQAEAIFLGVPQASLAVVPDCGHFLFAESPALFRQIVLEWMAANEHASPA